MISVIAIDNAQAEASLLQLAATFAATRLFTAKQQKGRAIEVQVTSAPSAIPTSREQLAKQKGAFGPRQLPYHFVVSTAYGFDSAAQQMMHELVHIAQVAQKRLMLQPKRIKQDGVKHTHYTAKFCGRKMGLIDSLAWDVRPWEAEAVTFGQQLFAEFQAFISATQGEFPAYGTKKELKLQPALFALPELPPAPLSQPQPAQPPMPGSAPFPAAQDPLMADPIAIDPMLAQAQSDYGDMPLLEEGDDDLIAALADIEGNDAGSSIATEIAPAPAFAPAFDGAFDPAGQFPVAGEQPITDNINMMAGPSSDGMPTQPAIAEPSYQLEDSDMAADRAAPPASSPVEGPEKEVFIQGIVAPRRLKSEAISEMRARLASKGLLS